MRNMYATMAEEGKKSVRLKKMTDSYSHLKNFLLFSHAFVIQYSHSRVAVRYL